MGTPSTRTVLQKADLGVGTLAPGGLLSAEDARNFVEVAIAGTAVSENAQVIPMKSPTMKIPRFRFNARVLRAGSEATALLAADRSTPTLAEVTLDTKLLKAELRISKEALEDNIEGAGWLARLRNAIAKAARRDLEELFVNGDTASADLFLKTLDGIRKQCNVNTLDAGVAFPTKGLFKDCIKTLPVEFQQDRGKYWFYTSPNAENELRDSLASRATVLGDQLVVGADSLRIQGSAIKGVPVMPENLGVGNNETEIIYTDPKNIVIGFHRKVEMESDTDIAAGQLIVVVTLRADVKVKVPEAAVKVTKVKVSA